MRFELKMNFPDYSEEALEQVVTQAPGKSFFDGPLGEERQSIGTIISASRIDSSNAILFEVEVLISEYFEARL